MSIGNFYNSGNHGLNVIVLDEDDDYTVGDTIANIVSELKKYSVDAISFDTPRSFDTGMVYAVYNDNNKVVAILEVAQGYYEHANINIYTGEILLNEFERDEVTFNKRDIKKVVDVVKMNTAQYKVAYQFSNGETGYVQI